MSSNAFQRSPFQCFFLLPCWGPWAIHRRPQSPGCTFWLFCWNLSIFVTAPSLTPSWTLAIAVPYAPWQATCPCFEDDSVWLGPWQGRDHSQEMKKWRWWLQACSLAGQLPDPTPSRTLPFSHRTPASFLGTHSLTSFVLSCNGGGRTLVFAACRWVLCPGSSQVICSPHTEG